MKDPKVKDNESRSPETAKKGRPSDKNTWKRFFNLNSVFILIVFIILAFFCVFGYMIKNGLVVKLKIDKVEAPNETSDGYSIGYVTSSTETPFIAIIERGSHNAEDVIGNEAFALMVGGKGEFFTKDIGADKSEFVATGYMTGYQLREADLSGVDIETSYRSDKHSTFCDVGSIKIKMNAPDTGILIYNIHNSKTFDTIYNCYNVISGDESRTVLSDSTFEIELNTTCDESLYIEPLFFVPAAEIDESEFEKGDIVLEKSGDEKRISCPVTTNKKADKNGYCIFERELLNGSAGTGDNRELSVFKMTDGSGMIVSPIENSDASDPAVDLELTHFIETHTLPNNQ